MNCVMYSSQHYYIVATSSLLLPYSTEVPTHVSNIIVNLDQKTITWTAPAETNGIIVRYRVQYWELGRRDTAEEVNVTAEKRMFIYSDLSKLYIGIQYTNHNLHDCNFSINITHS